MDNRGEVRDFLTTRRARITPAEVGLPAGHTARRVPGLRRREVADLARVSIEYYTRIERGNLSGVSTDVLEAIARALLLNPAELAYLRDLAGAQGPARRRAPTRPPRVRPEVQATLDGFTAGPAFVRNGRMDLLAANLLGRAVYGQAFEDPITPPNLARYVFLDPRARDFYDDWDRAATDNVALLRAHAGRDPADTALTALVGVLSTRSEEFRVRWAAHDVRIHDTGSKHFHHPIAGDLYVTYQELHLFAEDGLSMLVYSPRPGTGTEQALQLLASWSAPATDHPRSAEGAAAPAAHRADQVRPSGSS